MPAKRTQLALCAFAVLAGIRLTGCVSVRSTSPGTGYRFLPAKPAHGSSSQRVFLPPDVVEPADVDLLARGGAPPEIESPLRLQDRHEILESRANLSQQRVFVSTAEQYFHEGERLYEEGDLDRAREKFDQAVEILLTVPESLTEREFLDRKTVDLIDAIADYDITVLGAGVEEETADQADTYDLSAMTFPVDPKLKDQVVEQVRAAVSQLPLEVNEAVLASIRYFTTTTRGRRTVLAGTARAGRYRAMIERILDEEGIPRELIHLAQAESGFQTRAVSRKRATGMWQFIRFRGNQYGLTQSPHEDLRLDPEQATRAAARHLRDLYHQFGDWYLAMAAYNCGPYNVERAVERTGYADFWELHRRGVLPRETLNYVPTILAIVIISKYPKEYGLPEVQPDRALDYDKIEISAQTNLALVSDLAGCSEQEIRELNPSFLKGYAPAGSMLRVPKDSAAVVRAGLALVPEDKRRSWRAHQVRDGDTLATIAKLYRTSVKSIMAANDLRDEELWEGDLVMIPLSAKPAPARSRTRDSKLAKDTRTGPRAEVASAQNKRRS